MIEIELVKRDKCSGCTACANVCPKNCIKMLPDDEGFLYPKIDSLVCTECGLCQKVCPVDKIEKHLPLSTYALKSKNDEIRLKSTSGAVFETLSKYVLNNGGVVFGCKFNEDLIAEHDYIEYYEGLDAFRGAKYVQSRLNNSFKNVKSFLEQGRWVLFSGTPCQIAGLDFYLNKEYDKLIKCDLVCHSVPSPNALKAYIKEIEETNNKKVSKIWFRNKELNGWTKSNLKIIFEDDTVYKEPLVNTAFMQGFNRGLYNRPSCANCSYKDFKNVSDITIADYWGIEKVAEDFADNIGVSLVFINSLKGRKIFEEIKENLVFIETKIEESVLENPYIITSSLPHKNRSEFFKRIDSERFSDLVMSLLKEE